MVSMESKKARQEKKIWKMTLVKTHFQVKSSKIATKTLTNRSQTMRARETMMTPASIWTGMKRNGCTLKSCKTKTKFETSRKPRRKVSTSTTLLTRR